jgi:hypothetical protein
MFDFQQRQKFFSSPQRPDQPTQPHFQYVPEALLGDDKKPMHKLTLFAAFFVLHGLTFLP